MRSRIHIQTPSNVSLRGRVIRDRRHVTVLMSPRECHVTLLEVPPVGEREITSIVKYKLRSEYPGNGAGDVDWRRNGRAGVVAIAAPREKLRLYRDEFLRPRLLTTATIALAVARKKPSVVVVAMDSRFDVFSVESGTVLFKTQSDRARLAETFKDASSRVKSETENIRCIIVGESSELEIDELGPDTIRMDLAMGMRSAARRERGLFSSRQSQGRLVFRTLVSLLLLAMAAGLARGMVTRFSALRSAEQDARDRLLKAQAAYAEAAVLTEEIERLESGLGVEASFAHPYEIIAVIVASLDSTVRLEQVSIRDSSFEFRARGASALDVLERLQRDGAVSFAELRQVTASGTDGEAFVITGGFGD